MESIRILPGNINKSWDLFFDDTIKEELRLIDKKIGADFNPEAQNVMRFLNLDLSQVKVVVLGQDPYPEKGRATGRAFEVGGLNSWQESFRQVSLKNIVRLLHKSYNNIVSYDDIKPFSEIKKEISDMKFKILPPDTLFKSWEHQGVLLLNVYLTCKVGEPGSHRDIWRGFMERIISYISNNNKDIIWFLWGDNARGFKKNIPYGKFYECRHPMMCSQKYEDDFLKSECFKGTGNIINWLG